MLIKFAFDGTHYFISTGQRCGMEKIIFGYYSFKIGYKCLLSFVIEK